MRASHLPADLAAAALRETLQQQAGAAARAGGAGAARRALLQSMRHAARALALPGVEAALSRELGDGAAAPGEHAACPPAPAGAAAARLPGEDKRRRHLPGVSSLSPPPPAAAAFGGGGGGGGAALPPLALLRLDSVSRQLAAVESILGEELPDGPTAAVTAQALDGWA